MSSRRAAVRSSRRAAVRPAALALTGTLSLALVASALTACGQNEVPEPVVQTTVEWVEEEASEMGGKGEPEGVDKKVDKKDAEESAPVDWVSAYERVLDNPGQYKVGSAAKYTPTGKFSYALVEMDRGGKLEMLLKVEGTGASPVLVFQIGREGSAVTSEDVLLSGTTADGTKYRLDADAGGHGIYQFESNPKSPQAFSTRYVLEGKRIKSTNDVDQTDPDGALPGHESITFYPASDRGPLRAGKRTTGGAPAAAPVTKTGTATATSAQAPNPSSLSPALEARGTIRDMSHDELQDLAGEFYELRGERYLVLVLDEETPISGRRGGADVNEVVMAPAIVLGTTSKGANFSLDGRRISLHLNPQVTSFSGDPSLPYSVPSVPATDAFVYID